MPLSPTGQTVANTLIMIVSKVHTSTFNAKATRRPSMAVSIARIGAIFETAALIHAKFPERMLSKRSGVLTDWAI